jgi:hypothetical protein
MGCHRETPDTLLPPGGGLTVATLLSELRAAIGGE